MIAATTSTSPEGWTDLAEQLRLELAGPAPEGLRFTDHVLRQDAALERVIERLRALEPALVGAAVAHAVESERDGWVALKLLEVCERMQLVGAAPALIARARRPAGDERERFLAGRACEVLLALPLDAVTRAAANEVSEGPLRDAANARYGAQRVTQLHRPRHIEWLLLAGLMALAVAAFVFAFGALS